MSIILLMLDWERGGTCSRAKSFEIHVFTLKLCHRKRIFVPCPINCSFCQKLASARILMRHVFLLLVGKNCNWWSVSFGFHCCKLLFDFILEDILPFIVILTTNFALNPPNGFRCSLWCMMCS